MNTTPIRVMIVDDHPLVREGLAGFLKKTPGLEVVAQVGTGTEALIQASASSPQVVLMDISLPDESGLSLARKLKVQAGGAIKILFLSMHDEEEFVLQAFRAGGDGYVVKNARPEEVVEGILQVHKGKRYVSAALAGILLSHPHDAQLIEATEREIEVLKMVAKGLSAKEVAQALNISHRTVEAHRANLMRKLGAKNSAELIRIATAAGLIPY